MSQRVLIVEDDEHVAALLRELLVQAGYGVEVAEDGLKGLLALQRVDADALLLDIMMPEVDGERLLAQVLEEHDGQLPLPVIVVTGSPQGARRCRELLGDDDVFVKPFDPTALLTRLADRLR